MNCRFVVFNAICAHAVFHDDIEVDMDQLPESAPSPRVIDHVLVPLYDESGQGTSRPVHRSELKIPSVKPLVPEADLTVTDSLFREDFAAWLQCPCGSEASPCIIQKKAMVPTPVLDEHGIMMLRVRQLKCVRHGVAMQVTSPHIFKQLWDANVCFQPAIRVLTGCLVLTEQAFRYERLLFPIAC
jgi:hypothetical protein